MLTIQNIAPEYRKLEQGQYNYSVTNCPHCGHRLLSKGGDLYDDVIGFFEKRGQVFTLVECPACFDKFYFHSREDGYRIFLNTVRVGRHKHYAEDGGTTEKQPLESTLAAARAVIAAFVYPHAPMTPAQRETWEAWEKLNDKETETK